jgi:Berberine and berberine like
MAVSSSRGWSQAEETDARGPARGRDPLAREPADAGALAALDADSAIHGVGAVMDEQMGRAVQDHLQVTRETMAPYSTGGSYLNFADRPGTDTALAFPGAVWRRLTEVKARFDPEDVFRSNHPVPPAA